MFVSAQQQQQSQQIQQKNQKLLSLDDALGVLMAGFLRGGVGFLKGTGEIIKGSSGVNRDVRVGVTHVSNVCKINDMTLLKLDKISMTINT